MLANLCGKYSPRCTWCMHYVLVVTNYSLGRDDLAITTNTKKNGHKYVKCAYLYLVASMKSMKLSQSVKQALYWYEFCMISSHSETTSLFFALQVFILFFFYICYLKITLHFAYSHTVWLEERWSTWQTM